jgi:flagellar hook-basal body complex protein FliE
MSLSIAPTAGPLAIADTIRPAGSAPGAGLGSGGFQDALSAAIHSVESSGREASQAVSQFLSGDGEEIHTAVLATERAELQFDLFLQTRNKVVSAYEEIMRMQV